MKKNDILLVGAVILAVLLGFIGMRLYQGRKESNHKIAVIVQNNQVIERVDLDTVKEPREVKLSGSFHEVILVEKGRIRFKEADCPDQICVKTGWLTERGEIAVCLPNKALITIEEN
ncbi:MAG: NusG domain II-containing protein [Clostridiales bacterium]|jgi:hypothetical protein|nr:NusG domain II-containing protein [Eubacteriales bacterium]MDH7566591.1 NusG domain II-containing protein [Clostridiales bacterium]